MGGVTADTAPRKDSGRIVEQYLKVKVRHTLNVGKIRLLNFPVYCLLLSLKNIFYLNIHIRRG